MLINSVLSSVPCVKVRKGMIVIITKSDAHGFPINSICKVVVINNITSSVIYADLVCNVRDYIQCLRADQLRLADSSERRIYRKQLKRK